MSDNYEQPVEPMSRAEDILRGDDTVHPMSRVEVLLKELIEAGGGGGGSTVVVTPIQQTGTKIANITVNGTGYDIYAPEGSSGSVVTIDPEYQSGTLLATLTIDSTEYYIYAPEAGGSNLILNAEIYSEDEKQVGVWIDNKPLYKRTYTLSSEITVANTLDWTSLGISADNIGFYVKAVAQNTVGTQWCVNCSTVNDNIALSTGRNDDTIKVKYLTIWYTKTTDTAGSGGYQAWGFSPIIYSTEEREVGVWIDNKPLYEKSYNVNFVVPNGSAWFNTNIDVLFIDNLVNSELRQDTAVWSVLSAVNNNGVLNIINEGRGSLTVQTITIWYTKTADVAGSGSYTTLGVPTHHYDGNEKVVGTWFGETLYENLIDLGSATEIRPDPPVQIDIGSIGVKQPVNAFGIYDLVIGEEQTVPLIWFKYNGNMFFSSHARSGCNKLILQYTKTTD